MYEKCIACGKQTDVLLSTPIEERIGYVEGVGQLCRSCYLETLHPGRKEQMENEAWLQAALNLSGEK